MMDTEYAAYLFKDLMSSWDIKIVISSIAAFILQMSGADHIPYRAVFALIVIDFLIGFYRGHKAIGFNYEKLIRGCGKIVLYFVLLVSAHQLHVIDAWMIYAENSAVAYVALTEFAGITKHLEALGLSLPRFLKSKTDDYLTTGKK